MSSSVAKSTNHLNKFRSKFTLGYKHDINWYPGHMNKGMNQMQRKLKSVDCIIEVHDARIPYNGRNPKFYSLITAIKPHLLVLNKADLSIFKRKEPNDPKILGLYKDLSDENQKNHITDSGLKEVILVNCLNDNDYGVRSIVPKVTKLIETSDRFNRKEVREYNVMIIGIPNVGKSTLINKLRHFNAKLGKATQVGALAGMTRSVLEKIRINFEPDIYVYDTPGIVEPNIKNIEMGLQLALCGTFQDHLVGEELMADYLLFWLNKNNKFNYVKIMGLKEPTDSIQELLITYAVTLNKYIQIKLLDGSGKAMRPNIKAAATQFIRDFRNGSYGLVMFEKI